MEAWKEELVVPRGYYISEDSTEDNIVFKRLDSTKIKTWEDLKDYKFDRPLYYIDELSKIGTLSHGLINEDDFDEGYRNVLPSKELAESVLAFIQLLMVRNFYIGDWKPNWDDSSSKYVIGLVGTNIISWKEIDKAKPLSFPTEKMASTFLDSNHELIEVAKPLI